MMFLVCSQSCSHLCSHSKPFLFIHVPSVPSTSRARTYEDPCVFGAQGKYRKQPGTLGTGNNSRKGNWKR